MAIEIKVAEYGTGQWTTLDQSLRDRFLNELTRVRGGQIKQRLNEWLAYLPPSPPARFVKPDIDILLEDGSDVETLQLSAGQVLQGVGKRARYTVGLGDELLAAAGID